MNFFLFFQIEIDAANDGDERHKTEHNQCSHIYFPFSLLSRTSQSPIPSVNDIETIPPA